MNILIFIFNFNIVSNKIFKLKNNKKKFTDDIFQEREMPIIYKKTCDLGNGKGQ